MTAQARGGTMHTLEAAWIGRVFLSSRGRRGSHDGHLVHHALGAAVC